MDRITVDDSLKTRLDALACPVEVVDKTGQRLGHFVPAGTTTAADDCPYSAKELEQMRAEEGGRPLSEIWKSLGAK